MHDVACEFARAVVRSKDAQKQLARASLSSLLCLISGFPPFVVVEIPSGMISIALDLLMQQVWNV